MTSPTVERPDAEQEREGGVPRVGEVIDGKVVVDPKHMLRGPGGKFLPGQRPATGIMPRDASRAAKLRERRTRLEGEKEQAGRERLLQRFADAGYSVKRPTDVPAEMWAEMATKLMAAIEAAGNEEGESVNFDIASKTLERIERATGMRLGDRERSLGSGGPTANVLVAVSGGAELEALDAEWTEG